MTGFWSSEWLVFRTEKQKQPFSTQNLDGLKTKTKKPCSFTRVQNRTINEKGFCGQIILLKRIPKGTSHSEASLHSFERMEGGAGGGRDLMYTKPKESDLLPASLFLTKLQFSVPLHATPNAATWRVSHGLEPKGQQRRRWNAALLVPSQCSFHTHLPQWTLEQVRHTHGLLLDRHTDGNGEKKQRRNSVKHSAIWIRKPILFILLMKRKVCSIRFLKQ